MALEIVIPPALDRILRETPALSEAFLVGGCVRDALLGLPAKDVDIEVFGLTYEELLGALDRWGRTDLVGRSFGVVKVTVGNGETYDFTVPRRDSKVGSGHQGFVVEFDPALTHREAASRRDFTINSLMYSPRRRELLDFFGGEADLHSRILRHTSSAFSEDALRVLRGMQFAGRFNLVGAPETLSLCQAMVSSHDELPLERIEWEWVKWAAKSTKPSRGLEWLRDSGWILHYPEIAALMNAPQDAEWHPEGDVFTHTGHCCDAMATLQDWRSASEKDRVAYMLAILTHDFGKPTTTLEVWREGRQRITSPGHEAAGVGIAARFLERIHIPATIRERVLPLVANHMVTGDVWTERAVRRLARRLQPDNIDGLCLIMTADASGRPPLPPQRPATVIELQRMAENLAVHRGPPEPIIMGRHLLNDGWKPSPEMGRVLQLAYEAQLEGCFDTLDGAKQWIARRSDQ